MTIVTYVTIYFVCSLVITYLLTCAFALRNPLPDRRKLDRRKDVRMGQADRRASCREQSSFSSNYSI